MFVLRCPMTFANTIKFQLRMYETDFMQQGQKISKRFSSKEELLGDQKWAALYEEHIGDKWLKLPYRGGAGPEPWLQLKHPAHGWLPVYGDRGNTPTFDSCVRYNEAYRLKQSNNGKFYFERVWIVLTKESTYYEGVLWFNIEVAKKARYKTNRRTGQRNIKWVVEGGDPITHPELFFLADKAK